MIEIIMRCDSCGIGIKTSVKACNPYPSKNFLIKDARFLGFTVGKKILCPDCSGKPNRNKALYEKIKAKGRENFDKIL